MDQHDSDPEPGQVEQFQAKCSADGADLSCFAAKQLTVSIGQRIRRLGVEEIWQALVIHCRKEDSGTLVVQVLVFNPDWDEALQIASILSRPADQASLTALGCNLNHVTIPIQRKAETPGGEQGNKETG